MRLSTTVKEAVADANIDTTAQEIAQTGPGRARLQSYLGCKQKLRCAVNDRLSIEPDAA